MIRVLSRPVALTRRYVVLGVVFWIVVVAIEVLLLTDVRSAGTSTVASTTTDDSGSLPAVPTAPVAPTTTISTVAPEAPRNPVRSVVVEGTGMAPTCKWGTSVVYQPAATYRRGDIVVFERPPQVGESSAGVAVLRVAGLPGERLEIRRGALFINGAPVEEPYLGPPNAYSFDPVDVPAASYYLLADRRDGSADSYAFGAVPSTSIRGVTGC